MNFFKWSYGIVFLWLVLRGIQNLEESRLNLFYATTKVSGPPCFFRARRVKKHVTLLSVHRFVRGFVLLQRSTLPFILILLANDVELNPGPVYTPERSPATEQPIQSRSETTAQQHRASSSLNCIAINARSLKSSHSVNGQQVNNLSRFQDLIYTENADLAFVTETWLHKDIESAELLPTEYEVYRKDRGSRAGGVLLAVKSGSFTSVHEIVDEKYELELISVELTTTSRTKLCICCCYRPSPPCLIAVLIALPSSTGKQSTHTPCIKSLLNIT